MRYVTYKKKPQHIYNSNLQLPFFLRWESILYSAHLQSATMQQKWIRRLNVLKIN